MATVGGCGLASYEVGNLVLGLLLHRHVGQDVVEQLWGLFDGKPSL